MSKKVDLTKPLNDEDRAYLKRRGRYWEIESNDSQFGKVDPGADHPGAADDFDPGPDGSVGRARPMAAPSGPVSDDAVTIEDIEDLNVTEIKEELKDLGVDPKDGKKADLVDQLAEELRGRGRLKG